MDLINRNDQVSPYLNKFILGDGRFELIEEVYNTTPFLSGRFEEPRSRWPTIDSKVSTIGSLLHQYAKDDLFDTDEEKIELYNDVMLDYFLQRYAS